MTLGLDSPTEWTFLRLEELFPRLDSDELVVVLVVVLVQVSIERCSKFQMGIPQLDSDTSSSHWHLLYSDVLTQIQVRMVHPYRSSCFCVIWTLA